MEMLFLGGVFSKDMSKQILQQSKGPVHYAANKLQWALIDGLLCIDNVQLSVLSAPFIGTYPKECKDLFFDKFFSIYEDQLNCEYVAFCNLWGYRNISRKNALKKSIKSFIDKTAENKTIIVYSPHTPFLQAAVYAKSQDPSIHICLIVPDLPQYMNLNEKKSFLYTQLKELDIKMFEGNLEYVDSFVLITEQMKDMLKFINKPYVVVEGVVSESAAEFDKDDSKDTKELEIKTIVYTGTLNIKFGIVTLLQAFYELDQPDICLKICGRGDAVDIINEYALKDNRIHYCGQISNDEAVKLQRSATILINPRPNNEAFTKYSFPSKNMEYLATGRPLIAFKLDGIPAEYDDYILYINENTVESMKDKIRETLDLSPEERSNIGSKARTFVLERKNSKVSGFKIFDMIKNDTHRDRT